MVTTQSNHRDLMVRASLTKAHQDYAKLLTARAYFKVRDMPMSEDLVQATFLKTWTYLAKGGNVDTMKAFLYHVLNGLIIDEYRKHKTTSLDTLQEKGFDPGIDESQRQINILDGKETLLMIDRLPKKYQKIMYMKYIQGLTLSEMAAITGQTKNTVAVQAHRGLLELKTLYFSRSPKTHQLLTHD